MITVTGSVNLSFTFPANIETAFEYYCDMDRTLNFLSHISIMHRHGDGKYRMLYSTTELGIYRVRIFCDLQIKLDRENKTISILPFEEVTPVKSKAGMYSLTGQGYYSSESIFSEAGDQTEIDYKLQLNAELPVPFGLRFIPKPVINGIARSITQWRIQETAEGFIERTIYTYKK